MFMYTQDRPRPFLKGNMRLRKTVLGIRDKSNYSVLHFLLAV